MEYNYMKKALVTGGAGFLGSHLCKRLLADGYDSYYYGSSIEIALAISADGKITDVITLAHNESAGYGDACATEEYYEQYKGKGDSEINLTVNRYPEHGEDLIPEDTTDIGAISSATYTTYGYQSDIKAAFEAFKTLTEGGND